MPSIARIPSALMATAATLLLTSTTLARDLRIISFNVWGVPIISPDRPARMGEIARRLAELAPDFVALQEVWDDDDAERLGSALRAAGLTEQRHFGGNQVGGRGSGLWIASRFPLDNERFIRFAVGDKPYIHWHVDYMARKGVALVDVLTPSGPITIANTHLQSTYRFGDYTFIQLAQVLTLADAVASAARPLVVAGDINAEPSSIVTRVLTSKLGLAPASGSFDIDVVMSRPSPHQNPVAVHTERLFAEPVTFPNGHTRTLSDHPCVLVDYDIEPCSDCIGPSTWDDTRVSLRRFLDDNASDTSLFITLTRTLAVALVPIAMFLMHLGRRRRLRGRSLAAGICGIALLLAAATWFAYVGWSYGPYKLDIIARLRER